MARLCRAIPHFLVKAVKLHIKIQLHDNLFYHAIIPFFKTLFKTVKILFELCDVASRLLTCYGDVIQPRNVDKLGDNCIQICHLGLYIVGYTVGNFVLRRRVSGAVKHDIRAYIRRYTSPNDKFEYGYPHSNVLFNIYTTKPGICLKNISCMSDSSIGWHPGGFSGNLQRIFSSGIRWRHSSGFSVNLQRIFSSGYF